MADLPIFRRYPALASLPRAELGAFPTPVQQISLGATTVLVKRDDLTSDAVGGNKVRGLEWILGDVRETDEVLTVGPLGSTHALATAVHARRLGASTTAIRWPQEMNPAATRVAGRLRDAARVRDVRWVASAYALSFAIRLQRDVTWIPAGGATPLAVLGQINAALELADQIGRRECPAPASIFVPLGTGGTAAGLALGLKIAGLPTKVVAVRVVPEIVGRVARVVSLANAAAGVIERVTTKRVPRINAEDVSVRHAFYGGGYGHPIRANQDAEAALAVLGARLDDTYSRKAFAAALQASDRPALFWLTFDGRLLN